MIWKPVYNLIILLLFTLFAFVGCDIKEPIAPSWDVEINMPLLDTTYTIQQAIEDDTTIKTYGPARDNLLYYAITQKIDSVIVGENLKIDPIQTNFSFVLGAIKINNPQPIVNSIGIARWTGFAPGQSVIFPPINNAEVTENFQRINEFQEARFDDGQIRFTISNNNGPLSISLDRIILRNGYNHQIVVSRLTPLAISANSTGDLVFDLAGKTLPDSMYMEIRLSTPGSSGVSILIPPDASTTITTRFENFVISQVRARVPNQEPVRKDSSLVLNDSTFYRNINIKNGTATFTFNNGIDLDLQLSVTFPELRRTDGTAYSTVINIGRSSGSNSRATVGPINLAGWRIASGSGLSNRISYNIVAQARGNNQVITISKTDSISALINMSQLIFDEITGRIKPTTLAETRSSVSLELGEVGDRFGYTNINFGEPDVKIFINNTVQIPIRVNTRIIGTNGNVTRTLVVPTTDLSTGQNVIQINRNDLSQFLNSFSSRLPDSLTVVNNVVVNPNYQEATIRSSDIVRGSASIEIPLKIGIQSGSFRDSVKFDFSSDDKDNLGNISNSQLQLNFTNGLPVELKFTGRLYDNTNRFLMYLPPLTATQDSSILIPAASVGADGKVVTPSNRLVSIQMTQTDVDKLVQAEYMLFNVRLNTSGTNNQPVSFRTTDFIKLGGSVKIQYRIEGAE